MKLSKAEIEMREMVMKSSGAQVRIGAFRKIVHLDEATVARLDRAAAEMSLLRREAEEAALKAEKAKERLESRWIDLTGCASRATADDESHARAAYLNNAVWKFNASGAVACRHNDRVVIVPKG